MRVTCPSCTTHYEMDQLRNAGPLIITCSTCGHRWKEAQYLDVIDLEPRNTSKIIDHAEEPELDVSKLVEAARSAKESFADRRRLRVKRMSGWAGLGAFCVIPFAVSAFVPETIVIYLPVTAKAYERVGMDVNIYGLDIRHIAQENKIIDGAHVLMVKGEISNSTNSVRKIPWLRFALTDDGAKELYTWTLDTAARPLRPGETTSFVTRVAAPPEMAKNLQIRFAHSDEIGSNPPL